MPTQQHVVVDGSNIATEARQMPSLAQLESAIEEVRKDFPDAELTVVVDATFAHRIDPSELDRFEAAHLRGELISPPAGAIGRGDAFLLRIAEKVDGTVLSNDSFQEFHGEHPWLFERGRLIGATPVPGVGWIFVPRTPVRGPKSRVAVRDASRAKAKVSKAIAEATHEAEHPEEPPAPSARTSRRSRVPGQQPPAMNDPITFITFIAEHKLGDEIDGEIEGFTSHGAVVTMGQVHCYAPLANLGDPPPRSAREVLHRGSSSKFVITALDPYRRGVELALPGVGHVSGTPREETVEAEVRLSRRARQRESAAARAAAESSAAPTDDSAEDQTPAPSTRRRRGAAKAAPPATEATTEPKPAVRRRTARPAADKAAVAEATGKTPAKKAAVKKKSAAAKAPAKKTLTTAAPAASKTPSKRTAPKKAAAKTAAPAKKVTPAKKTGVRPAPAKKAAAAGAVAETAAPAEPRRRPRRSTPSA